MASLKADVIDLKARVVDLTICRLGTPSETRKTHKNHSDLNRFEQKNTKESGRNHVTRDDRRRRWYAVDMR